MRLFEKQVGILYSLLYSSSPIPGTILNKKSGLSLKTIKKEIDIMNEYLWAYGFNISSRSGVGYEIEVNDKEKHEQFVASFFNMYYRNLYFEDNQNERVHYIVRRLLAHRGDLFIDDLADECYCSKSIINRSMGDVKGIFEAHELQIKNRTNHGFFVEGNEWNYRLLLIKEHKIFKNFSQELYIKDEYDFKSLFFSKMDWFPMIKLIVMEEIEKNHLLIAYCFLSKIIYMIILSITRKEYADNVIFDPLVRKFHEESFAYKASKNIYERIKRQYQAAASEIEIIALAAYINCCLTIKEDMFLSSPIQKENEKLAASFIEYLDKIISIKMYDTKEFEKDLSCNMVSFQLRNQLNVHIDQDFVINYKKDGLFTTDLCIILFQFLKGKVCEAYNINDILCFYPTFSSLIYSIRQQHQINVLVVSRLGYYYSKNMCEKFERLGHVNKVKCYPIEYTELKRIEKSKYDFVATDLDKEDFKDYTLATIKVHYYRTKDEFASFVNKISLPKSFKRDKLFNRTDVINITGVNTKEDLQFIIESIVLNEYSNVTSFLEEVNNRAKIINPIRKNQIAILKSNNDILKKTFLKILVSDKPIEWDNEVCSIIIIYNVKDNDLTILQYINRFIANVLHKDELICSENSTENYNAFCKYFNE